MFWLELWFFFNKYRFLKNGTESRRWWNHILRPSQIMWPCGTRWDGLAGRGAYDASLETEFTPGISVKVKGENSATFSPLWNEENNSFLFYIVCVKHLATEWSNYIAWGTDYRCETLSNVLTGPPVLNTLAFVTYNCICLQGQESLNMVENTVKLERSKSDQLA